VARWCICSSTSTPQARPVRPAHAGLRRSTAVTGAALPTCRWPTARLSSTSKSAVFDATNRLANGRPSSSRCPDWLRRTLGARAACAPIWSSSDSLSEGGLGVDCANVRRSRPAVSLRSKNVPPFQKRRGRTARHARRAVCPWDGAHALDPAAAHAPGCTRGRHASVAG
jgi:hypothetical protein